VNDNVRQGTALRADVKSRIELTFKDETMTRLGQKTIFSVGQGARTIDLGSGQFCFMRRKKRVAQKLRPGPGLSVDSKYRSLHLGAREVLGNHRRQI
jgi:hypothetical protein